jgi:hypothetical protein
MAMRPYDVNKKASVIGKPITDAFIDERLLSD